jgi:hypothetical protein
MGMGMTSIGCCNCGGGNVTLPGSGCYVDLGNLPGTNKEWGVPIPGAGLMCTWHTCGSDAATGQLDGTLIEVMTPLIWYPTYIFYRGTYIPYGGYWQSDVLFLPTDCAACTPSAGCCWYQINMGCGGGLRIVTGPTSLGQSGLGAWPCGGPGSLDLGEMLFAVSGTNTPFSLGYQLQGLNGQNPALTGALMTDAMVTL